MKQIKVGFLIMNFDNLGGTERVTSVIANGLVKNNYEVYIISCNHGLKPRFQINNDIHLYSLHGEYYKNALTRKIATFNNLKKEIVKEKIDIMVAVDVTLYLYLFPLQMQHICKCIAWEHFNYYIAPNFFVKFGRWLAANFANKIIVLGINDLNNYKNHYHKISSIEYIYNPVTINSSLKADMKSHKVIAVGRLTTQKGFDYLINIWSKLENRNPEWELDIYGEGELRDQLQKQIETQKLKNIRLCGPTDSIAVKMSESSIFVLTSRYEGFGLVLLEALSIGLPCMSFNCKEGPAEIIKDGVNGYLIEEGNIDAYCQKLQKLMNDEVLRRCFSNNSKMDLEKFNIDHIIHKWDITLNNVLHCNE